MFERPAPTVKAAKNAKIANPEKSCQSVSLPIYIIQWMSGRGKAAMPPMNIAQIPASFGLQIFWNASLEILTWIVLTSQKQYSSYL